eukprot:CAMPEP_0184408926 /NCGR_PEP_ID=MMETSP0738-20130409/3671_1 /TAXON_ID=385413 /ORGANISM="Thalassiosira miniscula, Strain CCMP1093" /LENGTH=79 /DNA_ID=CAMNT_0026766519 /DNA_START=247 /DNA_END=486 /DNA_ORIENTATION=-
MAVSVSLLYCHHLDQMVAIAQLAIEEMVVTMASMDLTATLAWKEAAATVPLLVAETNPLMEKTAVTLAWLDPYPVDRLA